MSEHELPWREALRAYIRQEANPPEKYGHQPRMYSLAMHVGAELEYDHDVVFAAIWLHDLGVFTGHRPENPEELKRWDSVLYAMRRAPDLLRDFGFPELKIPAVVEAIRTHQPGHDPNSIEGIIVRDADILEQLGAIGVLRTVCKVGRDTRFPTFSEAVGLLTRALNELPPVIRLETTRTLAKPKITALKAFLQAVEAEAQGALE